MFKSINKKDGSEIIILDPKWDIEQLRGLDRQNILVCQGCGEPVRVRAGAERRPHFAHKHLENCTYMDESSALRNARAILYEWLRTKFDGNVTIEKKIEKSTFPRSVDCWVETNSKVFAYWIFDRALKPEKRDQILNGFEALAVNVNFVFTFEMLRKAEADHERIHLTTTEREMMVHSDFGGNEDERFSCGMTLHYLDADNHGLLTYRGLHLVHQPQLFHGIATSTKLSDVLVSPRNGEFVHPGEYERRKKHLKEKDSLLTRQRQLKNEKGWGAPSITEAKCSSNYTLSQNRNTLRIPEIHNSVVPASDKKGTCIFCGTTTSDWWYYDDKTGQCKCNTCYRQGQY